MRGFTERSGDVRKLIDLPLPPWIGLSDEEGSHSNGLRTFDISFLTITDHDRILNSYAARKCVQKGQGVWLLVP